MKVEVINKFVEVFGDKAEGKFNALNEFKRLGLYKEVK